MVFLNRLSDSLFHPSEVLKYRVDKKIVTFFYFVFLGILLMIPNLVLFLGNSQIFDYETRTNIRYDTYNQQNIPYKIENNKLVFTGTNEQTEYFINLDTYEVTLIFTTQDSIVTSEEMYRTIIVFDTYSFYVRTTIGKIEIGKYSDYDEIEEIDFNKLNTNDQAFWNQASLVLKQVEDSYHNVIVSSMILIILLRSFGTLLLFTLFITLLNRISALNIYSFGDHFKLMVYYVTPFVIAIVLARLFQITIIEYIGLIVTFIYSLRINQINFKGGNDQNDNEL